MASRLRSTCFTGREECLVIDEYLGERRLLAERPLTADPALLGLRKGTATRRFTIIMTVALVVGRVAVETFHANSAWALIGGAIVVSTVAIRRAVRRHAPRESSLFPSAGGTVEIRSAGADVSSFAIIVDLALPLCPTVRAFTSRVSTFVEELGGTNGRKLGRKAIAEIDP